MALVSVALVVSVGCGGGGLDKERRVCAHVDKLCGGDPEPLDKCAKDLRELKEPAGETYDQFLDCSLASKSCPEFAGCFVGGLGEVAERWGKQFEQGVDRMKRGTGRTTGKDESPRGTTPDDDKFSDDDSTLPPECKRILDVCSKDEAMPRIKCRDMIGNIKADTANRAKLGSCIRAAKNCYDLGKCIDDLWFELN